MHKKFKTDVLETCQGHHPTDVFQGRFQGMHMMPLQNCNNRQQLAFHYFKELIL